MRINQQLFWVFSLIGLLAIGCGSKVDLAPVSGTVTFEGEPVGEIRVVFEPIVSENEEMSDYYTSFGITDEAGQYEMKTEVDNQLLPGAVVGKNTVRFVCMKRESFMNEGLMDSRAVYDLPEKAKDKSMTFTVPKEGTNDANFDL